MFYSLITRNFPANKYMFKDNNRDPRKRYKICS